MCATVYRDPSRYHYPRREEMFRCYRFYGFQDVGGPEENELFKRKLMGPVENRFLSVQPPEPNCKRCILCRDWFPEEDIRGHLQGPHEIKDLRLLQVMIKKSKQRPPKKLPCGLCQGKYVLGLHKHFMSQHDMDPFCALIHMHRAESGMANEHFKHLQGKIQSAKETRGQGELGKGALAGAGKGN